MCGNISPSIFSSASDVTIALSVILFIAIFYLTCSSLLHFPASGTAGKFIIHTKLSLLIHLALLHTAKVFIDDRLEKHPLSEHKPSAISSKSLTGCQVGPIASGQLADKIMAVPFSHNSFLPFTEIPC